MTLIAIFGRNVRQARKDKGWTQEQLAFEASVKRAYLSEIENGQRNVSLDVVEKLAKALDVPPDVLMVPNDGTRHDSRVAQGRA